jgi:hypothetical protein
MTRIDTHAGLKVKRHGGHTLPQRWWAAWHANSKKPRGWGVEVMPTASHRRVLSMRRRGKLARRTKRAEARARRKAAWLSRRGRWILHLPGAIVLFQDSPGGPSGAFNEAREEANWRIMQALCGTAEPVEMQGPSRTMAGRQRPRGPGGLDATRKPERWLLVKEVRRELP